MSIPFAPLQPRSRQKLSENVAEAIITRIASGAIAVGSRLPTEPELGKAFAVSRTVIREAIASLAAQGYVRVRQGSGTEVVSSPPASQAIVAQKRKTDPQELVAVMEVRTALESEAAGLAAMRRTEADLEVIQTLAAVGNAQSLEDGFRQDHRFHEAIAIASKNLRLVQMLPELIEETRPLVAACLAHRQAAEGGGFSSSSDHMRIVRAIRAQDPDLARASMRMHLTDIVDWLRSTKPQTWKTVNPVIGIAENGQN